LTQRVLLVSEVTTLSLPAVAIHGGAGTFERVRSKADEVELTEVMERALRAAWAVLDAGGPALTAVVDAVAVLEDSGKFNAGRGGARTISGELELDAAVMDGRTGRAGAVCATCWPRNPVRVAQAVAEAGGPPERPVLLAGVGADLFAAGTGLLEMVASSTPGSESGPGESDPGESGSPSGTVGAVAVDSAGHLAAATSTGGREGQLRGRVGDSPIIGAGTWADDETAAVSATGEGEAFLIAGFAHLMDWSLRNGSSLDDAVFRSMEEVARRGGAGGSLAMTSSGELVCAFGTRAMARGWKDATQTRIAVLGDKAATYGRKGDAQGL
jgi:isoaspartyl peptidase/L-asparaginase-like protein (Ntn-hydrolase superfamily)